MTARYAAVVFLALAAAVQASSHSPRPHPKRNNCNPGYFKSGGSVQSCSPGTYSSTYNAEKCVSAPAGTYVSTHGASAYTVCPAGSYSSKVGASSCTPCTAGYYCRAAGTTTPTACNPGTYSAGGATACKSCSPGTFNSIYGAVSCCSCCQGFYSASSGAVGCQSCPAGKSSVVGSDCSNDCKSGGGRAASCVQSGRNCPANTGPTGYVRKREIVAQWCKRSGEKSCPVYAGLADKGTPTVVSYECVNVASDLESCGGCVADSNEGKKSADGGRDCSAIQNLGEVVCQRGECIIKSCQLGYVKTASADGDVCELPSTPADDMRLNAIAETVFQNMS